MTLSLTSILSLTRPLTLTRYISIWQLVLLAGLMQALLHYGNLMLGEPMLGGLASWEYVNPFAALFVRYLVITPSPRSSCVT